MASYGSLLWSTVVAFPSISKEVNLPADLNSQLKCCLVGSKIHAETRYLLCILIYFLWLQQESNNNYKKRHTAVSKESLWTSTQPKSSPGFFSETVLPVLLHLMVSSLLVCCLLPPFFQLFCPCSSFFLQYRKFPTGQGGVRQLCFWVPVLHLWDVEMKL